LQIAGVTELDIGRFNGIIEDINGRSKSKIPAWKVFSHILDDYESYEDLRMDY
jgi:hypothetical protein